jgi:hypothetical protein
MIFSMRATHRRIILIAAIVVVGIIGWYAFNIIRALQNIPEAYAAWDTGTLLVEYMKLHGDQWPKSWDDLLTVMDTEAGRQILLRGPAPVI